MILKKVKSHIFRNFRQNPVDTNSLHVRAVQVADSPAQAICLFHRGVENIYCVWATAATSKKCESSPRCFGICSELTPTQVDLGFERNKIDGSCRVLPYRFKFMRIESRKLNAVLRGAKRYDGWSHGTSCKINVASNEKRTNKSLIKVQT